MQFSHTSEATKCTCTHEWLRAAASGGSHYDCQKNKEFARVFVHRPHTKQAVRWTQPTVQNARSGVLHTAADIQVRYTVIPVDYV